MRLRRTQIQSVGWYLTLFWYIFRMDWTWKWNGSMVPVSRSSVDGWHQDINWSYWASSSQLCASVMTSIALSKSSLRRSVINTILVSENPTNTLSRVRMIRWRLAEGSWWTPSATRRTWPASSPPSRTPALSGKSGSWRSWRTGGSSFISTFWRRGDRLLWRLTELRRSSPTPRYCIQI